VWHRGGRTRVRGRGPGRTAVRAAADLDRRPDAGAKRGAVAHSIRRPASDVACTFDVIVVDLDPWRRAATRGRSHAVLLPPGTNLLLRLVS